jgi:transcriptional regulator with XRE-family HTH domain
MHQDLMEIPRRMRELREILEISAFEMANRLGVPLETYEGYENGEADIPISTLYEVAGILNIDFTELITGEAPKMSTYAVTRQGRGANVQRYGYACASLAYNFIDREMEPLLVTLSPDDKPCAMVTHAGQEFNLVLAGTVRVVIGGHEHLLHEGDSIYFDPRQPHGQSAVDGPASFLTVIKE